MTLCLEKPIRRVAHNQRNWKIKSAFPKELEALILAYDVVPAARDRKAEQALQAFETRLDEVMSRHPEVSRDTLRKSIIKAHRQWALKQENKPRALPPKA